MNQLGNIKRTRLITSLQRTKRIHIGETTITYIGRTSVDGSKAQGHKIMIEAPPEINIRMEKRTETVAGD